MCGRHRLTNTNKLKFVVRGLLLDFEILDLDRKFAFELVLLVRHRLSALRNFFQTRLLLIRLGDVALYELFCLGCFGECLDVLAETLLIFRYGFALRFRSADGRARKKTGLGQLPETRVFATVLSYLYREGGGI